MRFARPWLLVALALIVICLGLVACTGSPYGPGGGAPAPTTTTSSGY
ncbi:MAG TPA: hypothetical protein VFU88_06095 [Ktedonobacterales bacterium]|nr:hypothetical protein [Ktedonobacterales bacterium]